MVDATPANHKRLSLTDANNATNANAATKIPAL